MGLLAHQRSRGRLARVRRRGDRAEPRRLRLRRGGDACRPRLAGPDCPRAADVPYEVVDFHGGDVLVVPGPPSPTRPSSRGAPTPSGGRAGGHGDGARRRSPRPWRLALARRELGTTHLRACPLLDPRSAPRAATGAPRPRSWHLRSLRWKARALLSAAFFQRTSRSARKKPRLQPRCPNPPARRGRRRAR